MTSPRWTPPELALNPGQHRLGWRRAMAAFVAAGALTITGCSSTPTTASDQQGLEKVTIAHDGTADGAAVGLGIEQGFFEDEGLEVEYLTVGAPPATVASVQSGQVDVGSIPTLPAITAVSQGVNILPFMAGSGYPRGEQDLDQYDQLSLYVAPDSGISGPAELEGRQVAVPARGAVMEVLISDAIRNDGGDPSTVNWIVLDFGSQVSALVDGKVDAAGLSLPFTAQAAQAGAELLMGPAIDFYEEGPLTTWIASPDTATDDELLMKLQRAIQKSNAYANDHRDEAMAEASEITGIDEQLFREARGFNFYPVDLKLEDFQRASAKMNELGFLKEPVDLEGKVRTAEATKNEEAGTP
jgi:ABC-type nitrate/sulfonate/bicarbonate transport system substrate-binding protein